MTSISDILNFYNNEAQKIKLRFQKSRLLGSSTQNNLEILKQMCGSQDFLGLNF